MPSEKGHPLAAANAGILIFILGLAVGLGTLELNRRQSDRVKGLQRAGGTVVDLVKGRPLVAFHTTSGERVSFTAEPADGRAYSIADEVSVLYDPAQPISAAIDPRDARWWRNGIAAAAAVLLMALGGYVAWYARQWDARRQSAS